MHRYLAFILLLLQVRCTTTRRTYDPADPGLAWDAECLPQNVRGMVSWLVLHCTFSNRTDQSLDFQAIKKLTAEKGRWRQPEAEEIQQLKKDLAARGTPMASPPLLLGNGGDRPEAFIAQVLVMSGVWLLQANSKETLPAQTEQKVQVKPGASVQQAFVLYKESVEPPTAVTLVTADGVFKKSVAIEPNRRERP